MKTIIGIVLLAVMTGTVGFALDNASHPVTMRVNEVCRIGLDSSSGISLEVGGQAAGGLPPVGAVDSSKALRYTSVVPAGASRRITANWGPADKPPSGTSLILNVIDMPAGSGLPAGQITLSGDPQNIITGIRSCSTGNDAVRLQYTFRVEDVNGLVQGDSTTVNISFTLTDAS
jgi:hypothetical protein